MPRNRLIYYGVIITVASALIWVGAWLARRVEWILPYTGALGVLLTVVGVALELRNRRETVAGTGTTTPRQSS
ncbi:MAG: hypothetical protein RMJ43_12095 [Chloroherpetonaceae bacterium]|nr:hypothetical protein [Chthonomonadaceae bacterium]MDW8208568.1 hypothetical protein [Chloroherpetonaceae bacterium]